MNNLNFLCAFISVVTFLFYEKASAAFNMQDVDLILQSINPPNSVEDFVKKLPHSLRQNYSLIHHSRSPQRASFLEPRVLMYDPRDAKVVISFNGPALGGQTIELMQFDEQSRDFLFHEIKFENNQTIFKKNIQQCNSCHRGKPILDTNPLWPGFYGAKDDQAFKFPQIKDQERLQLEEFLNLKPQIQGYRRLLEPETKTPNKTLNILLNRLNYQKAAKEIKTHFYHLRYQVIAAIIGCDLSQLSTNLNQLNAQNKFLNHAKDMFISQEKINLNKQNQENFYWGQPQASFNQQSAENDFEQFEKKLIQDCFGHRCKQSKNYTLAFLDVDKKVRTLFDISFLGLAWDLERDGLTGALEALPFLAKEVLTTDEIQLAFSGRVEPNEWKYPPLGQLQNSCRILLSQQPW